MAAELAAPGTTARVAGGRCPFMWAQSLYVVTRWALIGHTGSRDYCNTLSLVNCARQAATGGPPGPGGTGPSQQV